jgi:hypothetical protein
MQKVLHSLKRGRRTEAARFFKEAQEAGDVPQDGQLQNWLVKTIGKQATIQLVDAFAQSPCFYCKKGRVVCEQCDGGGHTDTDATCEPCIGLGLARCDFCDGSGWITITYVPTPLQLPVLKIRAQNATNQLSALLKEKLPRPSPRRPKAAAKKAARLLLGLEVIMGVLENTTVAAKQIGESRPESQRQSNVLIQSSIRAARKADGPVRQVLKCVSAATRLEAKVAEPESDEGRLATARADYYQRLSTSTNFAGTGLEHPFLQDMLQETAQKAKRNKAAASAERHSETARVRGVKRRKP